MLHATCMQWNRVDCWLLVVESQIVNLTLGPSFGHNLYFRCPNWWCEIILNIYVSIDFQWYKKPFNPLGFDPCNFSLNIWESTRTPNQRGSSFGNVRAYSLTLSWLPGACGMTPRLPSWPTTLQSLTLVASPRLGLWQNTCWKFKSMLGSLVGTHC